MRFDGPERNLDGLLLRPFMDGVLHILQVVQREMPLPTGDAFLTNHGHLLTGP